MISALKPKIAPYSLFDRLALAEHDGTSFRGLVLEIPSAAAVEISGIGGCDLVVIEDTHADASRQRIDEMVRAAYSHSLCALVASEADPWTVMTRLDTGAQGVVLKGIRSVQHAIAAIEGAFFPPHGHREANKPLRFQFMSMTEFVEWTARNVFVCIAVDSEKVLGNVEDLAALETVHGLLALPGLMGCPSWSSAELSRVASAAAIHGKRAFLPSSFAPEQQHSIVKMAGSDRALLIDAYQSTAQYLRATQE
ncbi:2-keto-3-deoxy-L-rhamnonate aldolase RhmA [Aminobacter niigataensis]|uniref:2-keto-3-deoxy-L-rhamnonate aldolase RhmA n=1 Tax=Aminobacter niigataensis TaxID=83265 RepID=A0ABR6L1G8_9HYPH|nr:aldolase/citrate lyase family protein [Aminobacter niigataensis]MBB4650619.1 2-keto-3-deoxy-L-rhamnonate aldolase RhmA [Aminobacter niigataensis]